MNVQESLRRIQEEAKRKAAATLAQFQGAAAPAPAAPALRLDAEAIQLFRDEVGSALARAISAKAARNYVGDVVANMQDIATARIRLLKSNDMGKNAIRDADGSVVLYPPNCRLFIKGDNGRGAVVIEDQPQMRTILTGQRYQKGYKTVRIPLPYLAFTISFVEKEGKYFAEGCGIGFRPTPLTSIDDIIFAPMLPHCDVAGNCQPAPVGAADTVVDLVNSYLNIFWNSSFVYAFRPFTIGRGTKKIKVKNFADWEKIPPLDILKIDFQSTGYSIRSLLERFDNGRARTVVGNQVEQHLHGIVRNLTTAVNSDNLTELIHSAAKEIVNTALQDVVAESALQPK